MLAALATPTRCSIALMTRCAGCCQRAAVLVYDGTNWRALASDPGKVLQVVSAAYTTEKQNITATLAATGLTVNITPRDTNSKVLVMVSLNGVTVFNAGGGLSTVGGKVQLQRDGTGIGDFLANGANTTQSDMYRSVSGSILDSPASASAVTYRVYFALTGSPGASDRFKVQKDASRSTIACMEISG